MASIVGTNKALQHENQPANPMQKSQIQPRNDHLVAFSQNIVSDKDENLGASFEVGSDEGFD